VSSSSGAVLYTEVLDRSTWGRGHWRLFSVISLNYFLDGVLFSIAPLVAFILIPDLYYVAFALNLLAETAGALLLGHLADRYGRRAMFTLAIALEVASLLLLFPLYSLPVALVALTSVLTFGIGGEFGAAYAAMAELSPVRHRGKALLLATNFWNVGAALIAGLALIYSALYTDVGAQLRSLFLTVILAAALIRLTRLGLPESPRWLALRGKGERAREVVRTFAGYEGEVEVMPSQASGVSLGAALARYRLRLAILAVVTVVQYVTYNMMAYYAPYAPGFAFGPEAAPYVIFVANLGAALGAIPLALLIDRARRASNLYAFLGGFLGSLALLLSHSQASAPAFYASLFLALVFSEWAWGALSVLQSELFPTGVRASVVGLLTSLTGIAGAAVVGVEFYLDAPLFLALASALWALGLLASLAWYVKGEESAKRPLEELA